MEKFEPDKKDFKIMTRDEVRSFDAYAINTVGIPGTVLMENAGRSCAEQVTQLLINKTNPKVSILCGTGNNGGDGFVIARHLINNGFQVNTAIFGNPDKIKNDAKTNLDILKKMNHKIQTIDINQDNIEETLNLLTADSDMIVDALFGTGLTGQLHPPHQNLINAINQLNRPILAVDIPSGLDCDTGQPLNCAIKADYTVTFVAVKKGFTAEDAKIYTAQIHIASIGINPNILSP